MNINIVKHCKMFIDLTYVNSLLEKGLEGFTYSSTYDLPNDVLSPWFNPINIRNLGLSRTYPHMAPEQYRPEYCLTLHCSNYLGLFLINTLYANRKSVLIEDFGGGMGWWFLYLNKLGFTNFNLADNFCQLSQHSAEKFIKTLELPVTINNPEAKPVITQNVGVPCTFNRGITPELELMICYTNRTLENRAKEEFPPIGFTFLCKDTDDLAFAYCRNDKYDEFKKELEKYAS